MREVGILEAKTNLSALVEAVERGGEEIMITRHGKPAARLAPIDVAPNAPRRLSGPELLARSQALRDRIALADPELAGQSWEEIKAEMRR